MGRPKMIDGEATRLSIALSKAQVERLRYMAIQMSVKEGRVVTSSEAARMAIEAVYPIPKSKQMDLFT